MKLYTKAWAYEIKSRKHFRTNESFVWTRDIKASTIRVSSWNIGGEAGVRWDRVGWI